MQFRPMTKKIFLSFAFFLNTILLFSQVGNSVYSFLDLPVSSRLAALGGTNVSLRDNDLNFAFRNPAMLTHETHNSLGVNMANYLADIQFGSAIYARNFGEKNYFALGVQYIDYGLFDGRDEINNETGVFTAKDMSMMLKL